MVFNKKAISPVVATALLLVVAVVAVVGFQTWFNTYQSGQLSNVEQQSATGTAITVERLEADGTVYLRNSGTIDINTTLIEVGGNAYTVITQLNGSTTTAVETAVVTTAGSAYDVVVVTADGIFQEKEIAR